MREIKFRAWDKALKRMTYSSLYAITFDGRIFYGNADVTDYPQEVMQYTGLKDSNGNEIYEGDILKSNSGYRLIVKFGNHGYSAYTDCVELGFYCECVSEKAKRQQIREDFLFWVREEQSEIIGNIHENPELLERR